MRSIPDPDIDRRLFPNLRRFPNATRRLGIPVFTQADPGSEINLAISLDQVLGNSWRGFIRFNLQWLGVTMAKQETRDPAESFVWRQGKELVTVSRTGDSWQVACFTQGRLMGPRQAVYNATHRVAKHAAWDVMARVISASHDEEEGVQAAMRAAQWMRKAEASGAKLTRA
jgi:hypothetical protein